MQDQYTKTDFLEALDSYINSKIDSAIGYHLTHRHDEYNCPEYKKEQGLYKKLGEILDEIIKE